MSVFLLAAFFVATEGFLLDTLIPGSNVCYGDLGCFNSGSPFFSVTHRPISVTPQSPSHLQTKFLLYTRSTQAVSAEEIIYADRPSITGSHYDGSRPTKFIAHGFTHNGHRQWVQTLKSELLEKDDMNVIVVDWQKGAALPYGQATANTRVVGAQIAQLANQLMNITGATPDTFHIIGHSLGAHVAGYAGARIHNLGRISGLDPADPYFQGTDPVVRLDPTDAAFVDVIHTDGSSIVQLGFGAEQPMGHVDFYPNGGSNQPGCDAGALGKVTDTLWTAVSRLDYLAAEGAVACSHERSYYYYIESIKSDCPFTAYPCTSADEFHRGNCLRCYGDGCSRMGYNADKYSARGSLYLETESSSSYCEYHYQFNITASNNFDGKLTVTVTGTNGTTGPIQLMSSNEIHNQGTIIHKMLKSRVNVGDVTSVTVKYDKSNGFLQSWAYPDNWHLMGISLWSGDNQAKKLFCAYNKDVTNHHTASFNIRGHCGA